MRCGAIRCNASAHAFTALRTLRAKRALGWGFGRLTREQKQKLKYKKRSKFSRAPFRSLGGAPMSFHQLPSDRNTSPIVAPQAASAQRWSVRSTRDTRSRADKRQRPKDAERTARPVHSYVSRAKAKSKVVK